MAAASEETNSTEESKPADEKGLENSKQVKKMKLEDLKVADLKIELEKRDLDKNGVKSVLLERLKAAIVKEGENPEEYNFEISSDSTSGKSTVQKLKDKEENNLEISTDSPSGKNTEQKLKEENNLEISTDSPTDSNITKELEEDAPNTNGAIPVNDETNNQEEKIDVALQLSIDEEEAQLNEDDNLIEVEKPSDIENNKIDNSDHVEDEPCDKDVTADKCTPTKSTKTSNEEKDAKTPVPIKQAEAVSAVSPKVLKVIGKGDKIKNPNTFAKSLWVTGLPNTTRAADLKALFSKQGKVLSVKIVKSTKQTPGKCYGYVTMATSKDTTKAIQNLHRTELNGRVISVERKQNESTTLMKKLESKLMTSTKKAFKKDVSTTKQVTSEKAADNAEATETPKVEKKNEDKKTGSEISGKKTEEKTSSAEKSKDKDRKHREKDAHRSLRRPVGFRNRSFGYNDRPKYGNFRRPFGRRPFSSRVGFGSTRPNAFAVQKLREERFPREGLRERREIERRRADERHRYIERKQKEEQYRLEREKERLRIERELLERERAEIIKFEREKQRMERERIEREREELRRQAELRRGSKRPFARVERDHEPIWEDRKKPASRYDVRPTFPEVPGSSRFEFPPRDRSSFSREYVRHPDKFSSQKHLDVLPRTDFGDRGTRREITIRTRAERQVFNRNDRDNRRSLGGSRERERNSSSRRDIARSDWKHDRRVQERIVSTNSSSGPRRMTYY